MSARNDLGVKVGDFFVCSWGYDQTNIDFYKVVGVTAKMVKVQQWKSKHEGDRVVPGVGPRTFFDWSAADRNADEATRRQQVVERDATIQAKRPELLGELGTIRLYIASYADAYLWDGNSKYETPVGMGH